MTDSSSNLGDRIRARRDARTAALAAITDELKTHIDEHFAVLHARLDKQDEKP